MKHTNVTQSAIDPDSPVGLQERIEAMLDLYHLTPKGIDRRRIKATLKQLMTQYHKSVNRNDIYNLNIR